MSEEKPEKEEKKSPKERMEEMQEKIKEMQGEGGPSRMPGSMGPASLMSRMAGMQGGGQQNKVMIKTMRELQNDMKEIKNYLREILEEMKNPEK